MWKHPDRPGQVWSFSFSPPGSSGWEHITERDPMNSTLRERFLARLDALRVNRQTVTVIGNKAGAAADRMYLGTPRRTVARSARWLYARAATAATWTVKQGREMGGAGLLAGAIWTLANADGRKAAFKTTRVLLRPAIWAGVKVASGLDWTLRHLGRPGRMVSTFLQTQAVKLIMKTPSAKQKFDASFVGRNVNTSSETMNVVAGIAQAVFAWRFAALLLAKAGLKQTQFATVLEVVLLGVRIGNVLMKRSTRFRTVVERIWLGAKAAEAKAEAKVEAEAEAVIADVAEKSEAEAPVFTVITVDVNGEAVSAEDAPAATPEDIVSEPLPTESTIETLTREYRESLAHLARATHRTEDEVLAEAAVHMANTIAAAATPAPKPGQHQGKNKNNKGGPPHTPATAARRNPEAAARR